MRLTQKLLLSIAIILGTAQSAKAQDLSSFSEEYVRKLQARSPIPFVPFEYKHPYTGKIVSPSETIELDTKDAIAWGAKYLKVRDYYEELNKIEQAWNALGYSLRNADDIQSLKEVLVNDAQLLAQAESLSKALRSFDELVMTPLKSLDEKAKEFEARVKKQTEDRLNDLFMEAKKDIEEDFGVTIDPKEDPNMLQKPNKDLSNLIHKEWLFEKGDPQNFHAKATATLDVSGSIKQLDGLADSRVDVTIMKELKINVLYMYIRAMAQDSGKAELSTGVEVLGNVVDTLSTKKTGTLISWRLSDAKKESSSGTGGPWQKAFRDGADFPFSIGPIPAVIEIGASGRVYLDTAVNADAKNYALGASIIPGCESAAYANFALGVPVAKVGIEQDLILVNTELNLGGDIFLDIPESGEPSLNAGVKGTFDTTGLAGRLKFFAAAKIPVIGEKRYERKLFEWEGIRGTGVLFDHRKIADRNGFRLTGAPKEEDFAELRLDTEIKKFFDSALPNSQTKVIDSALRQATRLKAEQDAIRAELNQYVGTLN